MQQVNVCTGKEFKDSTVNRITHIKTERINQETYYFKPGQVIDYHRHPEGDQIFFVHEGEGLCYIDDGKEESAELKPGMVVLAPKGIWHKIVATTELIVSAATSQPSGLEKK